MLATSPHPKVASKKTSMKSTRTRPQRTDNWRLPHRRGSSRHGRARPCRPMRRPADRSRTSSPGRTRSAAGRICHPPAISRRGCQDEVEALPRGIDAQPDPGVILVGLRGEAAVAEAGIDPDLSSPDLRPGRHGIVPGNGRRHDGAHRKNAEQAKSSDHVPPRGLASMPSSPGRRSSGTDRYSSRRPIFTGGIS